MKAEMQPVVVRWMDARTSSRWMDMEEFEEWRSDYKSREIVSCGLLAHYGDDGLVLIKSRDIKSGKDQAVSQCLEIPKGMVRSVRLLKETKGK